MVIRKKLNITIILLVPLFILFLGAMSKQREEKESPAVQSVKAQYAEHGPYQVGIQNFKTESERVLEITVWYPALDDDYLDQEITYRYEIKMGEPFGTVAIASFDGQAVQDAPYDLSMSPYPLAVLSPGFSIGSTAYA